MDFRMIENTVCSSVEQEKQKSFELSRYIFDNPELGYQEHLAVAKYVELLRQDGIKVYENYLGVDTAFMAVINEDPDSDIKIGIFAEYDALPEVGHGCGHCASGALSYLAALALYKNRDLLKGNIYLIGTPAEEIGGFKKTMAQSGLFNDFSYMIMLHMAANNRSYTNILGIVAYKFEFFGSPAHAAICPWEGKNALNGMTLFMHALDMMRQQLKDGARIHGILDDGGVASNIIPDYASCNYCWRYNKMDYLDKMTQMILDAAEGCAKATQTTVKYTFLGKSSALKETPYFNSLISEIYQELGIKEDNGELSTFGSSDIGDISQCCPATQALISVSDEPVAIHTKEFAECMLTDKTRTAIVNGAKTIAKTVVRSIYDPEIIPRLKADFEKMR